MVLPEVILETMLIALFLPKKSNTQIVNELKNPAISGVWFIGRMYASIKINPLVTSVLGMNEWMNV